MSELIFYGTRTGRVFGPYDPDEISARAMAVRMLNKYRVPVYMVRADTHEEARRKLANIRD